MPGVSQNRQIGAPISSKTALFNALTGSHQKVANYPGVAVEPKAGKFITPEGDAFCKQINRLICNRKR